MSRMTSSRAAAIKSASSKSESPLRICSLESGAARDVISDVNFLPSRVAFFGERLAIGRIQEVKNAGTDFAR